MQTLGIVALPIGRAAINAAIRYQEDVVMLMHALPGNPRIENVAAALTASGETPYSLYLHASAGNGLPASFLEALYGPQKAVQR